MERPDLHELRQELARYATIEDTTTRLLEVAAIIGEALADLDVQPIVVGGQMDHERLDRRATEAGLSVALRGLRRLTAEIENGHVLETREIAEFAREIEAELG